ncbi:MAG: serine/threonine-protein kinase [Myxococcota bacterium]
MSSSINTNPQRVASELRTTVLAGAKRRSALRGGIGHSARTTSGRVRTARVQSDRACPVRRLAPTAEVGRARGIRRFKSEFALGSVIGRHVLLDKLGAGGMGVVYAAYDPKLDRKVALKVLRPGVAKDRGRARLLREAQALGKLAHPHVVGIYDVGMVDAQLWLAMEMVEGPTLRAWLRQPRSWREVLKVMRGAGEGLAAAHAVGLLHRDFKPDNVMVGNDGRARVMDFGLVRVGSEQSSSQSGRSRVPSASEALMAELTQEGSIIGTPAYMPPEQFERLRITAAADQFSFCATLWEALYGERPFMPDARDGVLRSPPKGRDVPGRLRKVCERGLARDPRDRWPSMLVLLEQLRRISRPRYRRWVALGAVVAVAGGLAAGWYSAAPERCDGAEAELAGLWDEERKPEVKAAILGTKLAYAAETWVRVEDRLDQYAESWASKHVDVCEATRVREVYGNEELGLRMRCMYERKRALGAAVNTLAVADATVVRNALKLVAGLPGLEQCDDLEALQARVPPPEDPEVAWKVEQLRVQIADIDVARRVETYGSRLVEAEHLVKQAEALGYGPVQAEAKALRGDLRARTGRFVEAEQDLRDSYMLAMEHGDDDVAIWTVIGLSQLLSVRQGRQAEGWAWGQAAMAHATRSGDRVMVALGLNNLGKVLHARGKYDQARHHYEQSLQIREQELGVDHLGVAIGLLNLGTVLCDQGKYEQARAYYERALEIREQELGVSHPDVAMTLNNLGTVFHSQGDYDEAKRHYERALRIREAALGPDHPDFVNTLSNLGVLLSDRGEHEQARRYHERVLKEWNRSLGPDHPRVATALVNLGDSFEYQEMYEQARVHFERALEIWEEALGPDHPNLPDALLGLARVDEAQGDDEAARVRAERAVSILEVAGVAPEQVAEARFVLARASWSDRSQRARARGLAEQARDGYTKVSAGGLAKVEAWLAKHPAALDPTEPTE